MTLEERFNRGGFSRFINSRAGRIFRLTAGSAFLVVGFLYRDHALGIVSMIFSILPLTAGGFDLCYISAVLGGPIRGSEIRARQSKP
jgi:hypothetical protein